MIHAIRNQERISCEKHFKSEVLFYCKTCEEPLCTDAIVEDPKHRQHEYIQLSKVFNEAKNHIDGLVEKYTEMKYKCESVIETYEKMLIEERYKNEIKLADFMKKVDE